MTTPTMQATTQERYGPPDVLVQTEIPVPEIDADRLLIRVEAASVNPYDWHMMTGTPWLVRIQNGFRRPKAPVGADGAGVVVAVGADVDEFSVGDEVFGSFRGSYAEYATALPRNIVAKPVNITFEEAASVPIAGLTALQGLRDIGSVAPGHRVLVNGASGGVGTFGVMIAKAMGAHVTAVCSPRNVETMREIGADEVIDYTESDYTQSDERYDVILDTVTTHGIRANRRVMADNSVWAQAGMKKKGSVLLLLLGLLKLKLINIGNHKKMRNFLSRIKKNDLEVLAGYLASSAVKPVIDRRFELADVADALRHQAEGHAQGKTIITI